MRHRRQTRSSKQTYTTHRPCLPKRLCSIFLGIESGNTPDLPFATRRWMEESTARHNTSKHCERMNELVNEAFWYAKKTWRKTIPSGQDAYLEQTIQHNRPVVHRNLWSNSGHQCINVLTCSILSSLILPNSTFKSLPILMLWLPVRCKERSLIQYSLLVLKF